MNANKREWLTDFLVMFAIVFGALIAVGIFIQVTS